MKDFMNNPINNGDVVVSHISTGLLLGWATKVTNKAIQLYLARGYTLTRKDKSTDIQPGSVRVVTNPKTLIRLEFDQLSTVDKELLTNAGYSSKNFVNCTPP